ncbi:MAG: response regulator [Cyclobacteriaceae bacterium]
MKEHTILIVDDNREIISSISRELSDNASGFQIINAGNGEMGVEIAKTEQPDIIIMDWDMPVMDGIKATRMIKNTESTLHIPVIISSGKMTTSENLLLALEAGAIDYIRKPIDFVELRARINTAIRVKEQNEAIKQLLENEIDLKNRQLSSTSIMMVEKNELLNNLHSDLTILESQAKENPTSPETFKSLKKRIQNHLDTDNSWNSFKIHFDEVHPHFFQRLSDLNSDISHKDLKICAYLKLGMDNKQIAQLLNITAASMRTNLYRLKKKLNTKEEDNLREFITEL